MTKQELANRIRAVISDLTEEFNLNPNEWTAQMLENLWYGMKELHSDSSIVLPTVTYTHSCSGCTHNTLRNYGRNVMCLDCGEVNPQI